MEDELKDLWDQYNKSSNAKNPLPKMVMAKKAEEELRKFLNKIPYAEKSVNQTVDVNLADKYRKAWKTVNNRLPEWRRKEIDERLKNGTMVEDKTDFARKVASLAEQS